MPLDDTKKTATLYRMVMPDHLCPFGLKTKALLEREGYEVDDHWLETKDEKDGFMVKHGVKTTPQVWIDGDRIGGNLRYFPGQLIGDGEVFGGCVCSDFMVLQAFVPFAH